MADNLRVHVYRTDLEYNSSGLNDTDVIAVVLAVSAVWNPNGEPNVVYAAILMKLTDNFTVSSEITQAPRYRLVPDGAGGYKRYCVAKSTINVSFKSGTVAVDLVWDEDQGPPPL